MKYIYFIRHSLRDTSIRNDLTAPLTKEGQIKADQLADRLNCLTIDDIYSSPALRSIQTVSPLAERVKVSIQTDEALLERQIGSWVEDFDDFTRKQWQDFNYHLLDGESLNDVRIRMLSFYKNIINSPSKNVIIASHGTALAVLFNILTNDFAYKEWQKMTMPDVYRLSVLHEEILSFDRLNFTPSFNQNISPD